MYALSIQKMSEELDFLLVAEQGLHRVIFLKSYIQTYENIDVDGRRTFSSRWLGCSLNGRVHLM